MICSFVLIVMLLAFLYYEVQKKNLKAFWDHFETLRNALDMMFTSIFKINLGSTI